MTPSRYWRQANVSHCRPALRQLLSGRPESIEQVSARAGLDATMLAETLINEGICGELTDELATGYQGFVTSANYSAEPRLQAQAAPAM